MKLLFLYFLLTSDLVLTLAVRKVIGQLYCAKHISAYSSSGSQVKESNRVRSALECVTQCSSLHSQCQSGVFESVNKVCRLFKEPLMQLREGILEERIFFMKTSLYTSESSFLIQTFSDMLSISYQIWTSSLRSCLSLCACNEPCVAVSYDNITSSCFMSDEPKLINCTKQTSRPLHVKKTYFKELTVFGFSTNLAQGKVVNLSSLYEASHAGFKAIDGIYLPSHSGFTESQSLAHTERELSPWIQVDLEDDYYVDGVKIWDRSEHPVSCVNDRLANVRVTVTVTDTNFNDPPEDEICDYLPGQPPADIFLVTCHTRMYGRYVRVTAVEVNEFLNIYELEVHGLEVI